MSNEAQQAIAPKYAKFYSFLSSQVELYNSDIINKVAPRHEMMMNTSNGSDDSDYGYI